MIHWQAITESDLFDWFGMHEVARTPIGRDDVLISLKPGGFAEYIDAEMLITAASLVRRAVLTLDRAWMGEAPIPSPNACDLMKSFLQIVAPEHPQACELGDRIFDLLGFKSRMIARAGTFSLRPDAPTPPIAHAMDVFLGTRAVAELMDRQPQVRLANIVQHGRHQFQVALLFATEESSPVQ